MKHTTRKLWASHYPRSPILGIFKTSSISTLHILSLRAIWIAILCYWNRENPFDKGTYSQGPG